MSRAEALTVALLATKAARGPVGPRGSRGANGRDGRNGRDGDTGPSGESVVGPPGPQGDPGRDGIGPDERVALDAGDRPGYLLDKLAAGTGIEFGRRKGTVVINAISAGGVIGGGSRFVGSGGGRGAQGETGPQGPAGDTGATGPAGADAPSTLDVHLMGWDGGTWVNVLGDDTGRLMVTS